MFAGIIVFDVPSSSLVLHILQVQFWIEERRYLKSWALFLLQLFKNVWDSLTFWIIY